MINPSTHKELYKLLNIRRTATKRQIEQAYKKATVKATLTQNTDRKKLIQQLRKIDKAFETLSDITSRSKYDALDTYQFIQNFAWKKHRLSERDLQKFERFWSQHHINQELRENLDFDKFVPEYDLIWYTAFYEEEFFKQVEKKEQKYTRVHDLFASLKRSIFFTAITATIALIAGIAMIVANLNFIVALFLLLAGALGQVNVFLLVKQLLSLEKLSQVVEVPVVDKWIKVVPRALSKSVKYQYFLAFQYDGKIFYQQVTKEQFFKTKTGTAVKARVVPDFPAVPAVIRLEMD